jgi:hypothetical protein
MKRKPDSILFSKKIARKWNPQYTQPASMITPSIFCESCTTENQCDACHQTQWTVFCNQFDLCETCGVPKHPEALADGVHEQFTCTPDACEDCMPRQMKFLQTRGYCTVCFQKLELDVCFTCYCMCESEEDTCKPNECTCSCGECFQSRNAYEEKMQGEQ